MIVQTSHPHLDLVAFETTFSAPIGALVVPDELRAWFSRDRVAPLSAGADTKAPVRDLLRWGGFKPTGRNKPAAEYLVKAIDSGWLAPDRGINAAVDACNVASLHSGLPISVVDADRATPPWRVAVCDPATSYVFNPSGQEITIGGLLALFDAAGPCAGPVKDSQRTKTHDGTTRTLSLVWGTHALAGRAAETAAWYRTLLHEMGATTTEVSVQVED